MAETKTYVQPKPRPRPEPYDSALRYWVHSRTTDEKYLVQFDAYNFNGYCSCKDFAMNLEKFLKRGVTPEHAIAEKMLKLRPGRSIHSAFMCQHIVDAYIAFGQKAARVVADDLKTRSAQAQH